ncbi:alcohol dehydrogenase catalytic domain-containing protein [Streptomyces sp. SP18CS02]|uniref:alcohol dehydrogenase catalytic domain-containing protein n=1 Tax=Streptomyces sp. SP18CS02 TaxID=3002531 RepID=UPI002E75E0E2|nr:alcohol dehydrogenase catalytic domain-containing protein [Streptomyces sp. SP18CS02]MEE1756453.1 alcohol dehydrogenase catalytic domain-containing protein [Streptomyces sp. SP18CS02]
MSAVPGGDTHALTGTREERPAGGGAPGAVHGRSHRALVREPGGVRTRLRPTPVPGPGELLVATGVAGLCGTDLQMLRGLRDDPAPVIGHEGIARVVAAGAGAGLRPGTEVVVNPTHRTDPSFLLGHNVDGLLQERTLIPATAVSGGLVVPLARIPDPVLGALLEPLAAVRYALALLATGQPRTLVVYGDGTVGRLAVRAARRWLGSHVRTVLVHHTRDGLEWSARHRAHGADVLLGGEGDKRMPLGEGPVAALIATPRDGTPAALDAALRLGARELTVDLFGGLPPDAVSPLLPGADLARIRAANCAGHPRPYAFATATTTEGAHVRLTGHRGVGNEHLRDAAAELCRAPETYRELVTHVVGLDEAARIMNQLAGSRERTVDGRRLIKLAVRVAPESPSPLENR